MNGRIYEESSPEARLAAVCKTLLLRMRRAAEKRRRTDYSAEPDYADFRDALKLPIERELVAARLDEIMECQEAAAVFRTLHLRARLAELDRMIAAEASK